MKYLFLLSCLCLLCLHSPLKAQSGDRVIFQDVIYLKSGLVVRGTIVKQIPGEVIHLSLVGGSLLIYPQTEIEKISIEPASYYLLKMKKARKTGSWPLLSRISGKP